MEKNYKGYIFYLACLLNLLDVPNRFNECYDGAQLRFDWHIGDVACHSGTYGANQGKVETYEFPWDNGDVSVLTPQEAAARIANLYYELKEE